MFTCLGGVDGIDWMSNVSRPNVPQSGVIDHWPGPFKQYDF